MSELTYLILKFGFLALMWVFVFVVVYALRSDLFGQSVRRLVAPARGDDAVGSAPSFDTLPASAPLMTAGPVRSSSGIDLGDRDSREATRLVITAGAKEGLEIDLPEEQLTIGRSSDAGLIIRDDYTSSHHARLLKWPNGWVVQDLDSTNGTFLDGARVHTPTYIPLHTPVTIGTTTFELRR
jgi:hypothetical protein